MSETTLLIDGLAFPEGPRWRDGALWFSDFYTRLVSKLSPGGVMTTVVEVPGQPSGLGWLPDGRLLVVSMVDRRLLRLDPSGLTLVADLSGLAPFHCNDMVVDKLGRAYVGNFGFNFAAREAPRPTGLIMIDVDGRARVVADDLWFPNGAVITPDGRTLIVGESYGRRLTAFAIAADGSLSGRRVWAQFEREAPDGICMDAESAIWIASPVTREVVRVREGGAITDRIGIGQVAVACALGGEDGRSLYILSTGSTSVPAEKSLGDRRGRIEVARVTVPAL